MAVLAGLFVVFTSIYGYYTLDASDAHGRVTDRRGVSSTMAVSTLLAVTLVIFYDCYNLTLWTAINFVGLTLIVSLVFYLVENFTTMSTNAYSYGDHSNVKFWLVILLNVAFLLGIRVAYNTLKFCFYPNLVQQLMVRRNRDYNAFKKMLQAELGMMQPPMSAPQYGYNPYINPPSSPLLVNTSSNILRLAPPSRPAIGHRNVLPLTSPMPTASRFVMSPQLSPLRPPNQVRLQAAPVTAGLFRYP